MSQPAVSGTGLITGEAVVLDLRPARLGSRSLALLVDLMAEGLALSLLLSVAAAVFFRTDPGYARALLIVCAVAFLVGYPVVTQTFWQGRTIGKAWLGIRTVRTDGGTVRVRHALVRTLVGLVEFPLGLAVVSSLVSPTGRRLGDIFAGTAVVHDNIPMLGRMPLVMPPPLVSWALAADINGVDERLATDIRAFLGRAPMLRKERRWALSAAYANALVARISPPPPPGAPAEHVLHAVMAERQRRQVMRAMPPAAGTWHAYPPLTGPQPQQWQQSRPPGQQTDFYASPPPAPQAQPPAPPAGGDSGGDSGGSDSGGFTLPS
jgi:uncharacterized RDD family membrane protein YckC